VGKNSRIQIPKELGVMALMPPNGEQWIACEWRIFVDEACPYQESIWQFYVFILAYSALCLAIFTFSLTVRWTLWGYSPFRKEGFIWWLRLNPTEMIFFAMWSLSFFRTLHAALILFSPTVPLFLLNLFYSLGHTIGTGLCCYYWVTM